MKYLMPVVLFMLLLSACKVTEQMLYSKWQITDVTFTGDLPEKEKEETRKQFMAQKTITFNSDHTMQLGDKKVKGWRMSAKGDSIYMKEGDKESVILVQKLSAKGAVLQARQGKKSYNIHLSPLK